MNIYYLSEWGRRGGVIFGCDFCGRFTRWPVCPCCLVKLPADYQWCGDELGCQCHYQQAFLAAREAALKAVA